MFRSGAGATNGRGGSLGSHACVVVEGLVVHNTTLRNSNDV